MQILRLSYGIKGFVRITDYALRLASMEQTITAVARHRAKVLVFWRQYGLAATKAAFEVSRATLYAWQAQQRDNGGGIVALNPTSKRPHHVRKRTWSPLVVQEIRRLRTVHPNLGKEKIYLLIEPFCQQQHLACPKPKTIGRIMADQPDKMRITPVKVRHNGTIVQRTRVKKHRKPKGFVPTHPGHLGAFDTVERFVDGCRRYVITFTDVYSRFAFAWSTTSHASLAAKEVFDLVRQLFPYKLEYILTDNGSEFMKHFDQELKKLHKTHWHTYPKTPKMNAHVERFNRTIQEEFVDYHVPALLDTNQFNAQLIDYLLWYNTERPHWSLKLQSPIQFLLKNHPESRMWWPNTIN